MSLAEYFNKPKGSPDDVPVRERCTKCGTTTPPIIRYRNDPTHKERIVHECVTCGYKWSVPTFDSGNVRAGVK